MVPAGGDRCGCEADAPLILDLSQPSQICAGRAIEAIEAIDRAGVLFRAHHLGLDRAEVVWVIEDSGSTAARSFQERARALAGLQSVRVARVYDCLLPGDDRADLVDAPMVFLEALEGRSLAHLLTERAFTLSEGLQIALDLCEPLAEMHSKGLAHGQLDPSMVFIEERMRARLASFGPGNRVRLPYFPGDGRAAQAHPRDDVYALGMILARIWLDEAQWVDDRGIADAIDDPQRAQVVRAMLAPRKRRLRDAQEVITRLHGLRVKAEMTDVRQSIEMPAMPPTDVASLDVRQPAGERSSRPWRGYAGLGALLLIGVIGLLVVNTDEATAPRPTQPASTPTASRVEPAPAPARPAAPLAAPAKPIARPSIIVPPKPTVVGTRGAAPARAAGKSKAVAPPLPWPAIPSDPAPSLALRRGSALPDGLWLYAARSEITQGRWSAIAGDRSGHGHPGSKVPVVNVTLGQARWFCDRLSARDELPLCYGDCTDPSRCSGTDPSAPGCTGYRLPTLAEWKALTARSDVAAAQRAARKLRPGAEVCRHIDPSGLCEVFGGVWEWTETTARGRRFAFRVGGSWERTHRKTYTQSIQHAVGKPETYLGFRPVRAMDDPRVVLGTLAYDPVSRQLIGDGQRIDLDDAALALLTQLASGGGKARIDARRSASAAALVEAFTALGTRATVSDGRLQVWLEPSK